MRKLLPFSLLLCAISAHAQLVVNGSREFVAGTGNDIQVPNEGVTGTTNNKLAKLSGAPSTALITATTDTGGAIGIVRTGAGTSGSANIARMGEVGCVFDGATT